MERIYRRLEKSEDLSSPQRNHLAIRVPDKQLSLLTEIHLWARKNSYPGAVPGGVHLQTTAIWGLRLRTIESKDNWICVSSERVSLTFTIYKGTFLVRGRGARHAVVHGVTKSWTGLWLNNKGTFWEEYRARGANQAYSRQARFCGHLRTYMFPTCWFSSRLLVLLFPKHKS